MNEETKQKIWDAILILEEMADLFLHVRTFHPVENKQHNAFLGEIELELVKAHKILRNIAD